MTKPQPLNVTVTRVIPADATTLFNIVSDITNMPTHSPETVATQWLDGATGPAVGARFKGTNHLGPNKWSSKPTITELVDGERFAFKVPGKAGATWTYTFGASAAGTVVTESMVQTKASPLPIRLLLRRAGVTDRAANLRDAMNVTLERLEATAVSAAPVR
jgi:hypothetical protein